MKFPVLRFIHYCLWIVGVAGGILIFLSPFLVYLFALRNLPTGASTSADLVRILPNLLVSGLAGIVFAVPVIALAELIALGLAIESHLAVSRRTNEQAVLLLERIANRGSRPASAVAPGKPTSRPAPAPAAPPVQPAPKPAPSAPPPVPAASAVTAAPPPQPEPPVSPPRQPETPAPAPQPEPSVPEPPAEASASAEPEVTVTADVAAQNAFVFERPDVRSRYLGSARPGHALRLYGRDESGQWLSADATGTRWIQASHVKPGGDVFTLPVFWPPLS